MPGRFLAGVAALIRDPQSHYLLLRRAADKDFAPEVWECVTGRLEQGEGFEQALHREVREETGLTVRIECLLGTTHFHRGPAGPDSELVGVIYACRVDRPATPRLGPEHDDWRWADAAGARHLLHAEEPSARWLRRVLERAEDLLPVLPGRWREMADRDGMET